MSELENLAADIKRIKDEVRQIDGVLDSFLKGRTVVMTEGMSTGHGTEKYQLCFEPAEIKERLEHRKEKLLERIVEKGITLG